MKKVLYLDIEWANSKNKSICQIGLVSEDFETEEPIFPELNLYINPEDQFDENCVAVHNITKSKVKDCPNFTEVWPEIEKYFTNSIIIGHNVKSSDLNAIVKNLRRYNIDIPIIIDLSGLSFTEKIDILTTPSISNKYNLFFTDEYTTGEYITQVEMIDMYQNILEDYETIQNNNYSITEALFYIYNKYKNRIYKEEKSNEKSALSRSLNQIMKSDNIVCVGYANYLNAIASILNIPVFPLEWLDRFNPNSGHRENIAVINDPKYDIKGVFTIDITWDSKKDENDTEYQNNIRHFLVPPLQNSFEKNQKGLVLPTDNIYYSIIYRYHRYLKIKEAGVNNAILWENKRIVIDAINKLYSLLNLPEIKGDCDLDIEIKKIKKIGKKTIPEETLKNIINNVTPRSEEELDNMLNSSYHHDPITPQERLLRAIFGAK